MQQKRSRLVWIVAIAIAFFFFVDPFRFFSGKRVSTVRIDRGTRTELASFVASAPPATDVILDLLQTSDVVLVGETGYAAEHAKFAADLIPVLDSAGIVNFGYQYANREDQGIIDELITARQFDDQLARRILFNHLTVFGFQEHVDILHAAWEVNSRKNPADPPFRIIALSNRLDYSAITNQEEVKDPEVMRRVFASGVPDSVMAEIISGRFLDRGVKAVAFMRLEHAFTALQRPAYGEDLRALGFDGMRRAGNALRAQYGNRVVTAALHGPAEDPGSRTGFGFPAGGVIDKAALQLAAGAAGRAAVGFRTASSPFAEIQILGKTGPSGETVTVSGFADAYIVTGPIASLTAVTPIADFVTEDTIDDAIRNFPGPSPEDVTAADMNEFISGNAQSMAKVFAQIK